MTSPQTNGFVEGPPRTNLEEHFHSWSRIERYTAKWNAKARPFVWTATADSILAKIKRLCERISAT